MVKVLFTDCSIIGLSMRILNHGIFRNAPLPVARKSSVGPPSSTVVSGGGGGLSPAAVGGPSTTGGGGMLSSSTTTPHGPVIGSTNLGTIGTHVTTH